MTDPTITSGRLIIVAPLNGHIRNDSPAIYLCNEWQPAGEGGRDPIIRDPADHIYRVVSMHGNTLGYYTDFPTALSRLFNHTGWGHLSIKEVNA